MKLPVGTYSFYNQFQNCPHKAAQIYVLRTVPYVESPEMAWGNQVHTAMENRIKHGSPLPDVMQAAEPAAAMFHKMSELKMVRVEYQLAMTAQGAPCGYDDSQAWFRGKLDCVVIDPKGLYAWSIDWKTGNVREDPFELETNALLLKTNQPSLQSIQSEYFWMKTGQNGLRYTFTSFSGIFARLQALRAEADGYLRAGEWPKRKNVLCGWCPVVSCEHNTSDKRK